MAMLVAHCRPWAIALGLAFVALTCTRKLTSAHSDDLRQPSDLGRKGKAVPLQKQIERAMVEYLNLGTAGHVFTAQIDFFRDEPTHGGVAVPKYYVWATARDASGKVVASGAARVAADRDRIDVLDFKPADMIATDPTHVTSAFPRALVEAVIARARQAR